MNALLDAKCCRVALVVAVGGLVIFVCNAFAQQTATTGTAEAERVIVTGSNIPTAEETAPNPVDTYRPADIEKLGIRNATDLQNFLPQEAGGTVNLNIANGGDGTVQLNLRGFLPKETLVLVDGKRVAYGSLGVAGFSQGEDINLIPFPMIDHIDILKDGASAVYGSDAVTGVVNFFLIHKFRGVEIGGSYANTNLGASNEMGEWEAWLKAGTGDDKTDMVVVADFWERTGGLFSSDRDLSANAFFIPFGGFETRSGNFPGVVGPFSFRLIPRLFFSANSPPPSSASVPGFAKDGGKNLKIKDGNEKSVVPVSTAGYNPCGWRAWLNNTTITLGMQNVFDSDPPFVAGSFENGYDESLATIKGRFWYMQLKKRF